MIEAGLGNFSAALANKTPGTYDVPFYYGGLDLVGTAKLTVTDSSTAAAPKLADADAAAARGGVLLTVMGQGVTNEPNALPAGSFSVGVACKGADDAWYTDVTINSAAIDAYYKPLVPPVAQAKVAYDAGASSLTATFKYDAAAQKWAVETPARVTFNATLVIAEPEQPATPSAPAEPTTPTAPTTPATTPSDAADAPASDAKKPAKAAKKALPQTGDNALAIVGLFGAAGAVTAALGVTAKRR